MFDPEAIIKSIRQTGNKDSNAYKVTEYYLVLTDGSAGVTDAICVYLLIRRHINVQSI